MNRRTTPAEQELRKLLDLMGYTEAQIQTFDDEQDEVLLHIESEEAGRLIGRGAQVLDALQYILNRILYQRDRDAIHCTVDIERYRERKKDRLLKEALDAAERVRSTGRKFKFSPMNAGDRRIVHQALKDRDGVDTYSEKTDEYGMKRVVVVEVEEDEPYEEEVEEEIEGEDVLDDEGYEDNEDTYDEDENGGDEELEEENFNR